MNKPLKHGRNFVRYMISAWLSTRIYVQQALHFTLHEETHIIYEKVFSWHGVSVERVKRRTIPYVRIYTWSSGHCMRRFIQKLDQNSPSQHLNDTNIHLYTRAAFLLYWSSLLNITGDKCARNLVWIPNYCRIIVNILIEYNHLKFVMKSIEIMILMYVRQLNKRALLILLYKYTKEW